MKNSDVENLKNYGLLLYLLEIRIIISGHPTNCLSGGPNLTQPTYVSCIIPYKKFRITISVVLIY